jgi:hypothetical protein
MPMRLRTWVIGHYYSGNRCPRCQRSGSSRPELDSYRWKKLRRRVRARDGNACRVCGATERLRSPRRASWTGHAREANYVVQSLSRLG